ncbi:MAG TPA: DUF4136 domain-containing protein [Allosphingosinicella sp.]|jgi:hypothetical protein|nr:DUF4136 domain-containing protein [Allosphingosinicella sp.]
MNKVASYLGALCGIVLLAGCTMDMGGGGASSAASVTRFHLGQPVARGPIAIESADPADSNSLEFSQVAAAVGRELTRLGWTVEPGGRSEQVAVVAITQGARPGGRSGGLSIGLGFGGGSYGRRSGVGVGVGGSIPVTGNRPTTLVGTELAVRIQRRSDATVAWEGRAQIEARGGSPLASRAGAADKLAWALFRDFPGESGRTIRVR